MIYVLIWLLCHHDPPVDPPPPVVLFPTAAIAEPLTMFQEL